MAPIPSDHGYDPSCGDFGVTVKRTKSHFINCASMEVRYDEFIDNEHTFHTFVLPWDGKKVSVEYVRELLNSAKIPLYIQNVSAITMILRCVDQILNEVGNNQFSADFSSVLVSVMSDKETFDYSLLFSVGDDEDDQE